jgi:acetyltransferase-like isoleucine patch superfamily enzyme
MSEAISPQQHELNKSFKKNPLILYKSLHVGEESLWYFLYFEICTTLLSNLSGLVGYATRSAFFRPLFKSSSKKPILGKCIVLKKPRSVYLAINVFIDDFVTLEAREQGEITFAESVFVGKHSIISAKNAQISIEKGVSIGSFCRIASQSKITIGASTLVGAFSYIGPGNHTASEEADKARIEMPMDIKGGVQIGANVWIGAHATIMDGVTIGDGATVAAHSFVNKDVEEGATVGGCPARILD